jgi:hypothetical protein
VKGDGGSLVPRINLMFRPYVFSNGTDSMFWQTRFLIMSANNFFISLFSIGLKKKEKKEGKERRKKWFQETFRYQ